MIGKVTYKNKTYFTKANGTACQKRLGNFQRKNVLSDSNAPSDGCLYKTNGTA